MGKQGCAAAQEHTLKASFCRVTMYTARELNRYVASAGGWHSSMTVVVMGSLRSWPRSSDMASMTSSCAPTITSGTPFRTSRATSGWMPCDSSAGPASTSTAL